MTVIYQGNFEKEGYRLGRIAAGLYRMPPVPVTREQEQPEGACPEELPQVI